MVPLTEIHVENDSEKSPKVETQMPAHIDLAARLSKTLYYGREATSVVDSRFSMPLSDLGVEFYKKATRKRLGAVDLEYASQVAWETQASPCALMMSFVYVNRLRRTNPDYLDGMGSADLFLISLMMASKYLCDEGEDEEIYNDEWADAGFMGKDRVNEMEADFLNAMDWRLFIDPGEFAAMRHMVEAQIALRESHARGWLTYTDIDVLTQSLTARSLCAHLLTLNQMLWIVSMAAIAFYGTVASAALASMLSTNGLLHAASHCSHLAQSLTSPLALNFTSFGQGHERSRSVINQLSNDSLCAGSDVACQRFLSCSGCAGARAEGLTAAFGPALARQCSECRDDRSPAAASHRYTIDDHLGEVRVGFLTSVLHSVPLISTG